MLQRIIRFSVRNKLIISLFTILLIIWGAIEVSRLPIDALPDITSNQVQVITVSPSLAAPEVERLITFPIEQANANIPGLREIRSISRFGLSVVTIVFNDDVEMYWGRQQVGERLAQVREEIPFSAGRPELAPSTTGLGEVFQYVVKPTKGYEGKYDLTELRTVQDWIIRRQLLGIKGVADVSSFGGFLKQYEVAIVPNRLTSMKVSIADVFNALQKNNQNSGGAYIEKGPSLYFIRTEGLAETIEDIGKIFVRHTESGLPIYIRDVAEVKIGHAPRYGAMTYGDEGEVAGGVVLMLKGANASEVIRDVKSKMSEIQKTLPQGVEVEAFYDRTKMVDSAIGTVKINLLEGALIVVFVLVLFLGNLRAGLIVASVIPLSMLFAVIMMNLFGVSGNLMSLGALDFGLIVDGAVIIVEAVLHRLSTSRAFGNIDRLSQERMNEEVEQSAGKMMNAAVFGQVIILIVYLPILTLIGIEGKMFRPMAQTVSFALIGAFLLSLTYVPMVSSWMLSKKISHKLSFSDRMINKLNQWYRPLLTKALKFPAAVLGSALVIFIAALMVLSTLGGEFIPELEEGDFAVDARIMTGSSLSTSIDVSLKAAGILKKFPEVEKIVTRIGASEIPTDPMPVEMTDIIISLKPKKEWTTAKSYDELAEKMNEAIHVIPGISTGFQFPVQMRFNELISGARQDVVCKIFGENLDTLGFYAQRMGNIIRTIDGTTDVFVEAVTGLPQIVIKFNRESIARYKVSVDEINQTIQSAFAGQSAGIIYENERRFDLVVRIESEGRKDIGDVRKLLIGTPDGMPVPLEQLATIELLEGPNQIQREDAKRRIVTGFNLRGRDVETVVGELQEQVDAKLRLPAGYYITYGGQFQNLVEATNRLTIAVPIALALIFILLYFAFGSLRYGVMIFTAIPLSAIGGIMGLWLRGLPFSISAGIGFIALFGVAVLNGIVLISEFNRLKKLGSKTLMEIIMEGTATRLRPVLMTAAVASFGFLPMALSEGAGAEVQRPLATVVIGGLITATLLTLFVLPLLFWLIEGRRFRKHKSVAVIVGLLIFGHSVSAQSISGNRQSLASFLERAKQNHLQLKSERLQVDYWNKMRSASFDPPKTDLGAEYGKFNSFNNDTRFFVSQGIGLPPVYSRKKDYYSSMKNLREATLSLSESSIEQEVKSVFIQMTDILEREKLLNRIDSIFARFLKSAELRLQTGESDPLEKATAESLLQQLELQQQALYSDLKTLQYRMQLLLNTNDTLLPDYTRLQLDYAFDPDTSLNELHPLLKVQQEEQSVARSQVAVERSSLLPEFNLGFNNQSLVGYQTTSPGTEKYFSASDRFNFYQLTMAVPIFNRASRARIEAAKLDELAAGVEVSLAAKELRTRTAALTEEYEKQYRQIQYSESTGLKHSELIIRNANLSFQNGNISYLEWVMLMQNAINMQLTYLDAVLKLNQTIIELQFVKSNK